MCSQLIIYIDNKNDLIQAKINRYHFPLMTSIGQNSGFRIVEFAAETATNPTEKSAMFATWQPKQQWSGFHEQWLNQY